MEAPGHTDIEGHMNELQADGNGLMFRGAEWLLCVYRVKAAIK